MDKPFAWFTMADLQALPSKAGDAKPGAHRNQVAADIRAGNRLSGVQRRRRRQAPTEPPRAGQRILEESEVAKLIDQAPSGRDQMLLRLLCMSGVRVPNFAQMKWCDLTPRAEAGQITVFGEGGKTRANLLKPKTWDALLALRGEAGPVDPVFRSQKGGHLNVSQIRRIVMPRNARACRRRFLRTGSAMPAPVMRWIAGAPIHLVSGDARPLFGFDRWQVSACAADRIHPSTRWHL